MHQLLPYVPTTSLIVVLFILRAVQRVNAQGIGLRLGPAFNTNVDLGTDVGFSLSADLFWSVDDDGLLGATVQYAHFGLNTEEAPKLFSRFGPTEQMQISDGGPTLPSIMDCARFRIHDELGDPSFCLSGGIGLIIVSQGDLTTASGTEERSFEFETNVALAGSFCLDYPIVGETLALTASLDVPINFYTVNGDVGKGVHIPAVLPSVGIEYRVEP